MPTNNSTRKLRSITKRSRSQSAEGTAGQPRRKVGIHPAFREGHKTKYVRNSKTVSGRLHDELVMMDLDQGKYFSLNPVATRIWDLLEKPISTGELCDLLIEEYDVMQDRCRVEVEEYLSEMVRLGVILRSEE